MWHHAAAISPLLALFHTAELSRRHLASSQCVLILTRLEAGCNSHSAHTEQEHFQVLTVFHQDSFQVLSTAHGLLGQLVCSQWPSNGPHSADSCPSRWSTTPAVGSTCSCVHAAADLAAGCMGTVLLPGSKDSRAWGRGCIHNAVNGHVGVALGGVGACPVARAAREAARAVHGAAGVVAHRREARHFWRWRPRRSGPVPWLVPCAIRHSLISAGSPQRTFF